jgi:hypothetical protein
MQGLRSARISPFSCSTSATTWPAASRSNCSSAHALVVETVGTACHRKHRLARDRRRTHHQLPVLFLHVELDRRAQQPGPW